MRKDVKFGLALSLVVVVVAGWYYSRAGEKEQAIPLAGTEAVDEASQPQTDATTPIELAPAPATAEAPDGGVPAPADTGNVAVMAKAPADEPVNGEPPVDSANKLLLATRALDDDGGDAAPVVEPAPADTALNLASVFDAPAAEPESPDETAGVITAPAARPSVKSAAPKPAAKERTDDGAGAVESYTVQPGDTFAVLAEIYYGSQSHATFLMQANPQVEHPNALRAGSVIRIPPLPPTESTGAQQQPASAEGARRCTVKPGDSFYRIAERELGSGTRWKEIFELNQKLVDGDPKALRPGMVLALPAQ